MATSAEGWRRLHLRGETSRSSARVELWEAGEGDPLVFLPGWGLSPRPYLEALRPLVRAGLRVVAPSLPGFGGSAPLPLGSGLDAIARWVGSVLDELTLAQPAFVAGHSLGGGVALRMAADRPELVRSLTLVNPVGGAPGRGGVFADRSWLSWAAGAALEADPRAWLPRRAAPRLVGDLAGNLVRHPIAALGSVVAAMRASLADEAASLVARGMPVVFVWSDRDRLILPGRLATVSGQLGDHVVPGSHGWLISNPELFAETLRNALVAHALGERRQRGHALRLPAGMTLADMFPPERRRQARHDPPPSVSGGQGAVSG